MTLPTEYFRAGVGAVVKNALGLVLAFERADVPGAWQFPQGGIERGEEPLDTILRELTEETGISRNDLRLIDKYPQPLVYELPVNMRSDKTGRGQVQHWFLFEYLGRDEAIDLSASREFRAWKWVSFTIVAGDAVEFRRSVYRALGSRFGSQLA